MKKRYQLLSILMVASIALIALTVHRQQHQPETMPLVPMMQLLLTDMQKVDAGIYYEDYEMIAEHAGNIADHPAMTQEDKKVIKAALGKQMNQFVAFDRTVHHHADSMRAAGEQENMPDVLRHYNIVQQGCVDCHTNYRQPIMEARKR